MSSVGSDDELARTATAVGAPAVAAASTSGAAPADATLGRYQLERELGAGGMGVVHAAFDPDLERHVALKVLRTADGGADARARLLREARAMARLTHPNVMTVYEVGSVGGRDFVAMELIDGATLAEWARASAHAPHELVDAFVAAGRGLAAAHAAGIIHRDFKPHNVLRARDGRILVTDFGLARAADAALPVDALATTLAPGASESTAPASPSPSSPASPSDAADSARVHAVARSSPGSLTGITQTGSLLGTPAYMAPEQWSGAGVGPASDQFAFCVALWEALTGERPYRGTTLEALRAEVERGPAALDDSRVPRRLRTILRRGLDPDPAARWRTMDALLAAITRAMRRRRMWLVGAAAVVVLAAVVAAIAWPEHAAAPAIACAWPERGPADVWPVATRAIVRARDVEVADVIDRDLASWDARHRDVCTAAVPAPPQLACLDNTLARLDATVRAIVAAPRPPSASPAASLLVDPAMCTLAVPPHLTLAPTPDVVAALELAVARPRKPADAAADAQDIDAVIERPRVEPCARAIALIARAGTAGQGPRRRTAAADAVDDAERCGDDRLRATALLTAAVFELGSPMIGPKGEAAIRRAATAADRIPQRDILASLTMLRATVEVQQSNWDAALTHTEQAAAGFGARGRINEQLATVIQILGIRTQRGRADDLVAAAGEIATWLPIATRRGDDDVVRSLRSYGAIVSFVHGDIAAAHATMRELAPLRSDETSRPPSPRRAVDGDVVDTAGKPVAGADVVIASTLIEDSVGIGFQTQWQPAEAYTTTDAHGHFAATVATDARTPVVAAQLGALRTRPQLLVDHVHLVLAPTVRLSGRVELAGREASQLRVAVHDARLKIGTIESIAPVAPDGTFVVDGISPGEMLIAAAETNASTDGAQFQTLAVRGPIDNLVLTLPHGERTVDVIVRSTSSAPLDGAQVIVLPGTVHLHDVAAFYRLKLSSLTTVFARPLVDETSAHGAAAAVARPGDLLGHLATAPPGELTACAIALAGDFSDPEVERKLQAQIDKLEVRCVPVGKDVGLVVIETPPMRRLD